MKKNNSGFTLVEMLVSILISVFILGGIIVVFLTSLDTWTVGTADVRLERTASLLMEKIIRGSSGQYGLREANGNSIVIDDGAQRITFSVDKNSTPTITTADDTIVRVYYDSDNNRLMCDPNTSVAGDEFEISQEGVVEAVTFRYIGDVVNIRLLMSDDVTASEKTVEMEFQTAVYLRKEG